MKAAALAYVRAREQIETPQAPTTITHPATIPQHHIPPFPLHPREHTRAHTHKHTHIELAALVLNAIDEREDTHAETARPTHRENEVAGDARHR